MKRNIIAIIALLLMIGTVGAMEMGSLSMLHGTIRCAVLLGRRTLIPRRPFLEFLKEAEDET